MSGRCSSRHNAEGVSSGKIVEGKVGGRCADSVEREVFFLAVVTCS
jgi:hypothetical protein